jgi:4-diphosphocytidyl-2-C-methyl-D-erythritol kinase
MHERYHSGLRERIAIDIEKNIPIAAGLAGGSADAAAVLAALADLWRLSDSERADLPGLAATLGADVPFCLAVQTGINACIATGRGDVLRAVTPLSCKVLLSTPDFPVSTAAVYAALKKEDCDTVFDTEALAAAAAAATDFDEAVRHAGNHLQAAALRLYPEIQNTLEWVGKQGNPAAVLVSGSGPSVFGLYPHGSPMEGKCVCHGPNLNTYFVATLS